MADMDKSTWKQRYAEPVVTGLIVCAVWAFIGYLALVASPWLKPILYGMVAAGVALLCGIAIIVLRRIPRPRIVPSEKNIESCIRSWLDNHRIGVKNDPSPESHFRLRITLDSGKLLTVVRMRDQPDYVQILADLGVRGEDKKLLEQFNEEEIEQIFWDTRVELARAQVGYGGLEDPPENFVLFRRVPIQHNLTEFIFISAVGSVEAAMNLVGLMFLKTRMEAEKRKPKNTPAAKPQLVSDTPILGPPTD
jgi:hypothetical protein